MAFFKRTYLGILFFTNKTGFACLILFIIFQAFFTYKGVQTLPFFNYGMFSEPFMPNTVQEKYIIKLDSEKLNIENPENNMFPYFLYENLRIYKKLIDPNYDDVILNSIHSRFKNRVTKTTLDQLIKRMWNNDETVENFPIWLSKFISKRTKKSFHVLEFEIEYYTNAKSKYTIIATETILKYEQ